MNIEIITIGSEILKGTIVDTNFAYLARKLKEKGFTVTYHTSVSDEEGLIVKVCKEALQRVDVLIVSGGLGPTLDDKTKEALCLLFNKKCRVDPEVKEDLVKRYGASLASLDQQSDVPEGVQILKNKIGTAPGFVFKDNQKKVYVMPGVPIEMEQMFEGDVLPDIEKNYKSLLKILTRQLHFCHLSESIIDPYLRDFQKKYKQLETGIYPGYGVVSVEICIKVSYEEQGNKILNECEEILLKEFSTYLFSQTNRSLASAIQKKCIEGHKTLILAESCTGGHLSSKIVDIVGSSDYFLGSIVCYSNLLKTASLGVCSEVLKEKGAVSREVVDQMIQGALKVSGADYALAISGVAGPGGGSEDKPVGTVWCGLGVKGKESYVWKILAKGRGKRETVIDYSANFMLGALWRYIAYQINPLNVSNIK